MKQRTRGRQGLTVSEIGYGSMGISMAYGRRDAEGGAAAIRRAHGAGRDLLRHRRAVRLGENEKVVGQAEDPWFQPGNFEKNDAAVDQLTELAAPRGATISQLALAWVLAQRDDIVPIPGSRNPERVEENVAAAELHPTAEDLDRIRQILPDGAQGDRSREGTVPTWILKRRVKCAGSLGRRPSPTERRKPR